MLILVIRTVLLYTLVVFALRLMGKKQLGELQPSELVTTILISNIATLSLEDPNLPMMAGVVPILLIVSLDVLMSVATLKNPGFRTLLAGKPRILISDGVINQAEMKNLRYTVDDLTEAMRDNGIFDVKEVQYAVVETTGKINFCKSADYGDKNPPALIVKNGEICGETLSGLGLDESWLRKLLEKNDIPTSRVYYLAANGDGDYNLIEKAGKGS